MQLIKLDAIDSTNDFLKSLSAGGTVENFTVVTAENQTKGKGQMGAKWVSEAGKNLVMSVLVKDLLCDAGQIYTLNVAVATAIITALSHYNIPGLSIKWPNDIMAGNKKIGGILIENSLKPDGKIASVVGIGLNVNQTDFDGLLQASSLANVTGSDFNKEELLEKIVGGLKYNTEIISAGQSGILWEKYRSGIFRKDVPMPFEDASGSKFMGIIRNVTPEGKLELLLEDDSVKFFGIKEIKLLY